MPEVFDVVLATLLIIAGSIWIGGYATVIVVSLVSTKTLDPDARVLFFRRFGAAYFWVSTPALLVALGIGWVFLARLPWSDELTRMAVASSVLVVILIAGIIQARNLTRLRERSAATPDDEALATSIRRRARAAAILRGLIGLITLGITVHAAIALVGAV